VIAATGLQLVDSSTLYATFDLPAFGVLEGFEAGRYDLRVVDPAGGSVLVPSSVNVIPNGRNQGRISVRFEASDRVRGDGVNPFAVRIANTSTANGYAPLVTLRSRQAGTRLGISPTATTFESYPFLGIASEGPAGVYAPGESGAFHFYLSAGGSESAVDMRVITSEDATPIDWGSLRDSLRPATIPVEAWGPIFENLTASITTWGEYVVLLNETAIALSLIGERVSDLQTLWAFHLRQAMNAVAPVPHLTSVVDGYLGLPGLPLGLDRTFGVTLADRYGVGLFGRGWVSSWDAQLERSADGMVRILGMGGAGRFFMPDAVTPGRFIGRFGETAELNLTDGFWRLREASGRITGFRFDGRIEWIEEAGGHRVTAGFAMGRLVTLTHSSGELLTITYGASGRPIELRDGAGRVTRYAYDASGERLLSVTTPGGVTTTYAYQLTGTAQLLGTLTSITIGTEVTLLTYDEEGRLAMSSRGGANVVRYRYAVGGRIDVIESTGTRVLFHDAFGRLVRTQDRFGRIEIVTPTSGGFGWHELGGGGLLFDRAGMIGGGEFVPAVATYAPKVIDARAEALSAIVGPEGVGDGRWVGGFAPLAYTIRFGNDATIVKAPVQVAEITQRLDASLDPSSLRLGSFGFGGEVFEVPEDRAEYATRLDLRVRLGIFVDVFAAIDIVTGIIRWSFTAIDPVTGDVPTDRETGFLPADALAVGGGGFVSYSVRLRAGVVTGTRIDAIASVIIDGGVAIETPKVFNIVDVTAPDVAVTEITELGGRYRVKWRGSDGDGGSGIARYDLYVSENDGPYTLWLDDTTLLEAEFVGVAGRRYRFYCNGFDLAGNVGLGSASRDHDYGDAPLPYPVTIAENGARHRVGSLFLGDAIGVHVDGLPDTDAEGDEGDNGVRLITTLIGADAVTTSTFTVFTSGNGRLDAWIDLNRDGDWDDSGEQLLMSVGVTTGLNVLPFNILAASRFGRTAARFRLSIEGGLSATGEADSGEVEDYLFVVEDGRGQAKRDVRVDMPESGLFRLATIDQRVVVRGEGRDLFAAPVGSVGSVAIVGGPSDDVLELGDYAGNYSYDTGGGSDTLQLVTQGRVIDLTRSTPDVPRGLAAIDLRGTGSNRVVLDPTSVEAIGPVGRPLRLVHDADDVITLGSGWRVERPVFDGVTFVHVLVTVTVQIEIVNTKPFQNPLNALDVNRDAKVEPLDALISLNMISRILGGPVIPNPIAGSDLSGHLYPDVTGDGNATPLDALLVINWLGRRAASGEGEFDEALSVDATVSDTQPNIQAPTEPDTKPGFEAAAIGNTPFGAWRVAPQPVATGTQPVATGTSGADGNASSDEPFGIDPSVTSPPKRAIVVGGIADRSLWSCAAIDDYFAASVNDEAANSESSIDDHGIGESPLDGLK
jgi:YD repeat-containing protein